MSDYDNYYYYDHDDDIDEELDDVLDSWPGDRSDENEAELAMTAKDWDGWWESVLRE